MVQTIPLIQGMQQYSSKIMAMSQILTDRGPDSMDGGGTHAVPLNQAPSDPPAATPTPTSAPTATPTASPSNTMVLAGATKAVTDASGTKWTITSIGHVAANDATHPTTASVTELAYVSKQGWQEHVSNLWWAKPSPAAGVGSPAGTSTNTLPAPVTVAASVTVMQSQGLRDSNRWRRYAVVSGSGDVISLSGGANTITDTGSGTFPFWGQCAKGPPFSRAASWPLETC